MPGEGAICVGAMAELRVDLVDIVVDLERFEDDYNDSETEKRIEKDVADGHELGVRGTPTFFVNGERLEPQSGDDLTDALDDALAAAESDTKS